MSNLTLIYILLVIVVVSVEVDAHERESENKDKDEGKHKGESENKDKDEGKHKAKEVTKSDGKHKVVKKCKCRVVLEDKTSVKCKNGENGKTKTKCKETKWKFGPEQECLSPGSGAGAGKGSGSGSTVGTGTGSGNGVRTTVSSPVTVTGGGYNPGTTDSGVVTGEVETPDEIIKMCADGRTGNSPPLFYFPSKSKTHFIQCDANGQSFLMTCGANTEWCQQKLTCDFVGACV